MSRLTTGQIAELVAIDARGKGIREEVQGLIYKLEKKKAGAFELDAAPSVPDEWTVAEHRTTLDLTKVKFGLHLAKSQKDGQIFGEDLRRELANEPVLNATFLDQLLKPENSHLVPEEWKNKFVFFWGTIYRGRIVGMYVRSMYWNSVRWVEESRALDDYWIANYPAAVLVSP